MEHKHKWTYALFNGQPVLMYDNMISSISMDEVCEKLNLCSALTKENERLKNLVAFYENGNNAKIMALTEQVEKLKQENANHTAINSLMAGDEPEVKLANEVFRLREERKELVEALRELYKCQPTMLTLIPDAALDFLDLPKKATLLKVESILSKFEAT